MYRRDHPTQTTDPHTSYVRFALSFEDPFLTGLCAPGVYCDCFFIPFPTLMLVATVACAISSDGVGWHPTGGPSGVGTAAKIDLAGA